MRIIARIPDVSEKVEPIGSTDPGVMPPPRTAPLARHGAGFGTRLADACPTWPVAALAVVAVVTWMLAAWNDDLRLRQQRVEIRLAREAATSTSPDSGTEAVVR